QILSTSQSIGSPAVSLIYVVYNGSVTLNGTTASDLLSQLTAELVGYFLFYPPLITAEPLEYHNLNTSVVTRPFWIITAVVKNPPNNLWIIAAVLAPIGVVTLIIIIITTVLCHKNKSDFKSDPIGNVNPRVKTAYWRDVGYYPQVVIQLFNHLTCCSGLLMYTQC
ncbi:hypothetical protein cypCar_00001901, partial [Cyprinus carpio]